jgi:RNA polymerase sigma factor (TIGR02999 family)
MPSADRVTRLLDELQHGREEAFDELFAIVYAELRSLAQLQRRKWTGNETLNTTALVHEVYLKLAVRPKAGWNSREHFLAAASKAIRHILLNYARDATAQKRGGDWRRTTLDASAIPADVADTAVHVRNERLIALDDALTRLARDNERMSRIVECRFFGGMSIPETAAALNISTATVTRAWATAQARLYRELEPITGTRAQ